MRSKWRWRRLLLIPVLASVHACDCSDCFDLNYQGPACALYSNNCGVGGQCALEGNTCASGFVLDTTTTCNDAGVFCCYSPPDCEQVAGACLQPVSGLASPCVAGSLEGYCSGDGVCCRVSPEHDGGAADAAEDVQEAPLVGSCNGTPCASGCECEPSDGDGGGAVCTCASTDAATDGEPESMADAERDDAGEGSSSAEGGTGSDAAVDASEGGAGVLDAEAGASNYGGGDGAVDATTTLDANVDGAAPDGMSLDAANAVDAGVMDAGTASACGVVSCGNVCTCVSEAMSACVCP